jgi:DNA-binding NarL/FixJ family response regulator
MSRALPLSALGRDTEALADAEAALAYALSPGSAVARQRAQLVSATVLIQSGALERARETVVDSLYESIRRDDELATRYNEFLMGRVFFEMGRLEPASRWLRDTVSGSLQRSPASLRESALSMQSTIASWRGDVEGARHAFEQLIPGLLPDNSPASLAQAWIAAGDGDVERAADLLLARAEESARRGQRFVAGTLLQEICRLGSTALAARAADAFARLLSDQDSALPRLRAATAVALAEPSEAGLAAAAVDWQQRGYLLHAAELLTQAAIQARAAGRGREATARLVTVGELVLATGGAATPLLRFAEAAEPLTPREREIATLAAQGLSSNEIAARLFLSPRTVNNHLQSTYSKLGIRGRHEFGGA